MKTTLEISGDICVQGSMLGLPANLPITVFEDVLHLLNCEKILLIPTIGMSLSLCPLNLHS